MGKIIYVPKTLQEANILLDIYAQKKILDQRNNDIVTFIAGGLNIPVEQITGADFNGKELIIICRDD